MHEMDLMRTEQLSSVRSMRNEILPLLPGFIDRPDGSLMMVYEGYLFELLLSATGGYISVSLTVAAPGPNGLLDRNVADLSFALHDKSSIVKAVGELKQKARVKGW